MSRRFHSPILYRSNIESCWPELGLCGAVILVDHSGDDAFSADRSQVGHVPDRLRLDVRGLLLPGLVRPVAVVMGHVLTEHQGQVALAEPRQTRR